jgi:hypothetical protein
VLCLQNWITIRGITIPKMILNLFLTKILCKKTNVKINSHKNKRIIDIGMCVYCFQQTIGVEK